MKLIDKSALLAEIERRLTSYKDEINKYSPFQHNLVYDIIGKKEECKDILSFIDTLEVKEVDFNKEIDLVEDKYYGFESLSRADIIDVAKHFFEFGMSVSNKAQKGV